MIACYFRIWLTVYISFGVLGDFDCDTESFDWAVDRTGETIRTLLGCCSDYNKTRVQRGVYPKRAKLHNLYELDQIPGKFSYYKII